MHLGEVVMTFQGCIISLMDFSFVNIFWMELPVNIEGFIWLVMVGVLLCIVGYVINGSHCNS